MKCLIIALFLTLLSACGGSENVARAALQASYPITWEGHSLVIQRLNALPLGQEAALSYSVDGSDCRADGTLNTLSGNWYSLRVRNAVALGAAPADTLNCSRLDEAYSPLQNPVFKTELAESCTYFEQIGT